MVDDRSRFSLWVDFIERDFIKSGLVDMAKNEIIDGATSNPSIFSNAILTSPAYKEQLATLDGLSPKEKYEALAIKDIQDAADVLKDFYDKALEGYVSIEVDPHLCNDTRGTIEEGMRLYKAIARENVMIKVPATEAGYEAMKELISQGINVNATLVFSPEQAQKTIEAMRVGLGKYEQCGGGRVEGVISVFVSRFDRMIDSKLEGTNVSKAKCGIMNAAKIYNLISAYNEPAVKILFASTGVKAGQDLPKDYYITNLYAKNSINTAPIDTIETYERNPNKGRLALPIKNSYIDNYFTSLSNLNIDINEVYSTLMSEGLKAFEEAFDKMLESLQ